jgi:hypothetical protein
MKTRVKNKTMTSEEVSSLLHISKRKCAWMLQNGMIPCKDTGKKTRRYTIYEKDVLKFKKDWEKHPEKYVFPVTFGSKGMKKVDKKKLPNPYYLKLEKVPKGFRGWLDDEWFDLNDALTVKEIEDLIGYDKNSVQRWITNGDLKHIVARGTYYIARAWLIDFMCDYAFRIAKKSEKHIILLNKYFSKEKKGKQNEE